MKHTILAPLFVVMLAPMVSAGEFVFTDVDRGWIRSNGDHIPSNRNTFTGANGQGLHNSFLVFDLSAVTGTVVTAVLHLGIGSYQSPDPSEPITIYEVSTPLEQLTNGPATSAEGLGIYEDLQSGNVYAAGAVPANEVVSLNLTETAVSRINTTGNGGFAVAIHPLEVEFKDGAANGFTLDTGNTALMVTTLPEAVTLHIGAEGRITWQSQATVSYQAQWSQNMVDPTWLDLGEPVIGDGDIISVNDNFNQPKRFYRVVARLVASQTAP